MTILCSTDGQQGYEIKRENEGEGEPGIELHPPVAFLDHGWAETQSRKAAGGHSSIPGSPSPSIFHA